MASGLNDFILTTFKTCFEFINPSLNNYAGFSQALSQVKQVKKDNNIQYSFDLQLDKMIKGKLKEFGVSGRIFSEESGFYSWGEPRYRVVFDPFCNSSLATKSFREAAIGLSIFTDDYSWLVSAIMDYQTGLVGLAQPGKTSFWQIQSRKELKPGTLKPKELTDAWVVFTLESREERKHLKTTEPILSQAGRVFISSGHIYWLKLAAGMIDGYLDPFGGEKLYEMFAATVAQQTGCLVTNRQGKPFDASEMLKIFEKDPDFIYYPVAARSQPLHQELLKSLAI